MIDIFEIIGLSAAACTTAAFVPQVIKTYKTKSADNVSLSMFVVFFIGVIMWLIYGIHLKSLAIILANSVTVVLTLLQIIFIIRYKD